MKKQVGIWIRVSTEDLAQGESPYYKPDQQTQGFRKCGQLRRSFSNLTRFINPIITNI